MDHWNIIVHFLSTRERMSEIKLCVCVCARRWMNADHCETVMRFLYAWLKNRIFIQLDILG